MPRPVMLALTGVCCFPAVTSSDLTVQTEAIAVLGDFVKFTGPFLAFHLTCTRVISTPPTEA